MLSLDGGKAGLKLLDRGVQLTGINSQLHALLLRVSQCEAQLGVLDSECEQISLSAHS
ncbi:hypothetical protein [Methylobacterium terrae]|uniref:hypothetical protein n=1 Tax=Methylobacterium terrae TaxID=2202827 RepID=UPI0013A5A966|nr:hypothetical protein [Methylobacterium terrae]